MTAHNDIAVYITKWLYSFLMQIFVQKVSIHMTRVTRMIKTKKNSLSFLHSCYGFELHRVQYFIAIHFAISSIAVLEN